MHLIVINPNTTASMTRLIGESALAVAAPGTTVTAVNPDMGPASIESHYDEALSVPGLLAEITRAQAGEPAADGFVIACFGDPGLDAARELADGPVVGIAEAAMHAASFLGRGFSVVTTLGRTAGRAWDLAERYGMTRFCRNVRACEIPVLALEDPESDAFAAIVAESRRAVADDGAEAIVLGCAGMADLAARMTDAVGVPVIDGVAAATKTVEGLVAMGLRTSARAEFAPPLPKAYTGLLSDFEIRKDWRTALVSGKRWKVARTGVEPLRELKIARDLREAHDCIYITIGEISDNARKFALENNIRMVGSAELAKLLPRAGRR